MNLEKLLEDLETDIDELTSEKTPVAESSFDALFNESADEGSFDALFNESAESAESGDFDALFRENSEDFDIDKEVEKLDAELGEGTVMKLDKKAQLRKRISMAAIQIAKTESPQTYAKYKAAQSRKVALEELMIKKYKSQALAKVKAEM